MITNYVRAKRIVEIFQQLEKKHDTDRYIFLEHAIRDSLFFVEAQEETQVTQKGAQVGK